MCCRKGGQLMKFEEEPTFMFNLFFYFIRSFIFYILFTIYNIFSKICDINHNTNVTQIVQIRISTGCHKTKTKLITFVLSRRKGGVSCCIFFLHWKFYGVLIKLFHAGYYELLYSRLDCVLTQHIVQSPSTIRLHYSS